MSDDGQHMFASLTGGWASYSHDGGNTWVAAPRYLSGATTASSTSCCISSDGQQICAGNTNGFASISTDGGVSWIQMGPQGLNTGTVDWIRELECTQDGQIIVACSRLGWASYSNDNGATWIQLPRTLGTTFGLDFEALATNNEVWIHGMALGRTGWSTP
jgi:hypothetical protein